VASDRDFVEYVANQAGLGAALTHRKMFGEYAVYLHGTVIAFICDNQLYVKPTPEGRSVLRTVSEHPPHPKAKPYFRIDVELDDRELLQRLFQVTARLAGAEAEGNTQAPNEASAQDGCRRRLEGRRPVTLVHRPMVDARSGARRLTFSPPPKEPACPST
jgi:TfoX/Sxy family transcriptional regulator of competence genes